jgi:hypothetical protein
VIWKMPDRTTAERRVRLAIDRVLSMTERLWVRFTGARYWRDHHKTDPTTGRTKVDHLRERGVGAEVWPKVAEALDRGVPEDELVDAVLGVAEDAGRSLATTLERRAPQMLREHRALRRGMHRRMRAIWGPAFDSLYQIYVCAEEIGSNLQQLSGPEPLDEALLGLHARACLVLDEIHALLSAGYPLGAWARTRSLHETAVIATLLADHGREPATADLAERFILRAGIDQARDLELAHNLGVQVDPDDLARVRTTKAELVAKYGAMYAKNYGWARPLIPTLRPDSQVSFVKLEEIADSGLSRLDYRIGNHHIHASAWTVQLNTLTRAGRTLRLTGPTNVGFTEPAAVAITSMLTSTSAVIRGLNETLDPMDLVGMRALNHLASTAVEKFEAGQAVVDEREARLVRSADRN